MSPELLQVPAVLFAGGGGGMFSPTISDLIPSGGARQYQQPAAPACGAGFLKIFVPASVVLLLGTPLIAYVRPPQP